jgi:light-regulated signal transduction histidine kinase (bacteriophytochrome)
VEGLSQESGVRSQEPGGSRPTEQARTTCLRLLDYFFFEPNEELGKRTAELEATNKELEAFAYSVSHDLRAPLRHMAGFTELLRKNAALLLNERSQQYVMMILESAQRMELVMG